MWTHPKQVTVRSDVEFWNMHYVTHCVEIVMPCPQRDEWCGATAAICAANTQPVEIKSHNGGTIL